MWKVAVGIAVLVASGGNAFAKFTPLAQETQEIATRFGSLTVDTDRMLLFKGRKLSPPIVGNNSLNLNEPIRIGATDVVLVLDIGGTGCPATYYFVTVSKAGARATKAFGTCSDLVSIKRIGNSIRVTMPGFLGPFEPEAARRRALRQRHVFIYRAGVVTENGKPVN